MQTDPVLSSLQVSIETVHRVELGPRWHQVDYSDDVCRFYFTESGKAFVKHHGREYCLRPGWFHTIPAHTVMSYRCPDRFVQHYIHFNASIFGGTSLFDYLPCEYEIKLENPQRVRAIYDRMRSIFGTGRPGAMLELNGLLLQLLALFVETVDPERLGRRQQRFLHFRGVLEYIDAHLGDAVSVGNLAEVAHLERTHFTRLFTKHFGVSPARYVRQKKIERAKGLLWEGNDTLEVIAERLGFSDGFHFSKVFKQIAGMSPREFRRQPRRLP